LPSSCASKANSSCGRVRRRPRRRPRSTFSARSTGHAGRAPCLGSCERRQALHICSRIKAGPPRHAAFYSRRTTALARASNCRLEDREGVPQLFAVTHPAATSSESYSNGAANQRRNGSTSALGLFASVETIVNNARSAFGAKRSFAEWAVMERPLRSAPALACGSEPRLTSFACECPIWD